MTERTGTWRGWPWLNGLLGVVVLALLVYLVVLLAAGARAMPGTTKAERSAQSYAEVRDAASNEITAFLRIDYKDMDSLSAAVLDGATGKFKKQYTATKENLKAAAQSGRAHSTGSVKQVAISELKDDSATVFVAADAVVTNNKTGKAKATKSCPHEGSVCRFYRLKIEMTQTSDGWKMSNLGFVS